MEYSIYITLDKSINKDYCLLSSNAYDEDMINLNIYTNGINKIDFKRINYLSFNERHYSDFISYFSYGRNIIDNANVIAITNATDEIKNTKKENRELMKLINNNNLTNKKIFIDVGAVTLSDTDMETVRPLKKCKNALITFDETGIYHDINELEIIHEIVNEIVKRTNRYDFSDLEKMLYSYDMIRTNMMINPDLEKKMEKILKLYNEPSFCYALIYKEVLSRFNIKTIYSFGSFFPDDRRAMNIVYVNDEEYGIEGIYYLDIGDNSKQRFINSFMNGPDDNLRSELVDNYGAFCKTKDFMTFRGCLDMDFSFGDFDGDFMDIYDYALDKKGINGIYDLRGLINNVGYFVDGRTVIDSFRGIKDEDDLEKIRNDTERYVNLFTNDIEGEDFLELLFNVRKVEYAENKELFPLNIEILKECLFNSKFGFSSMNLDFDDDQAYEEEDINEIIQESFDTCFEESIDKSHIEERIRKLKLSLNKDINKPKKDDTN